jgi:hypothetical protein
MLKGHSGNPYIVGRDRRSITSQLTENQTVIFRRLLINAVERDSGRIKKLVEFLAIGFFFSSRLKAGK